MFQNAMQDYNGDINHGICNNKSESQYEISWFDDNIITRVSFHWGEGGRGGGDTFIPHQNVAPPLPGGSKCLISTSYVVHL